MKKIIIAIIAALASLSLVAVSVYADVDVNNNEACKNWRGSKDENYELICGDSNDKDEEQAQERVKNILNTVFLWVGIIAVVVIIIGGVLYAVSQGDPAKIARAKATILYSVIGLIVVLMSFAIVNFVLSNIK